VTFEDAPDARHSPAGGEARGESLSSQLTQISRAMVAIYKDQFGRGPRHAHTHYAASDTIISVLEGSLTPIERTLAGLGETQRLRDIRLLFQYAAEDQFRSAVETITGRRVVAFISGLDAEADVSTEVFVLEPHMQPTEAP
jgi:uncharacterized protein YbcI